MKATDLLKLLENSGWKKKRQKGSHVVMTHDNHPGPIVVSVHAGKDVPIGTLNQILKRAGLK